MCCTLLFQLATARARARDDLRYAEVCCGMLTYADASSFPSNSPQPDARTHIHPPTTHPPSHIHTHDLQDEENFLNISPERVDFSSITHRQIHQRLRSYGIRQHTSAYVSIRQHTGILIRVCDCMGSHTTHTLQAKACRAYVSIRTAYVNKRLRAHELAQAIPAHARQSCCSSVAALLQL